MTASVVSTSVTTTAVGQGLQLLSAVGQGVQLFSWSAWQLASNALPMANTCPSTLAAATTAYGLHCTVCRTDAHTSANVASMQIGYVCTCDNDCVISNDNNSSDDSFQDSAAGVMCRTDGHTKCKRSINEDGYECACGDGYVPSDNGKQCLKINQCSASQADLHPDCTCERCACHDLPGATSYE